MERPRFWGYSEVYCVAVVAARAGGIYRMQQHTMHSVPGADLSDWDDYEINLDQRVLSPEICMAACMAGRPAGRR